MLLKNEDIDYYFAINTVIPSCKQRRVIQVLLCHEFHNLRIVILIPCLDLV
jgi:hypothetical protein